MGALAYLEWRYAAHRLRALLRSPARLLIWVPYTGFFIIAAYLRVLHARSGTAMPGTALPRPAVLGAGFVALLGMMIALSTGTRTIAFRSRAEAILLSNARLDPLTIVTWLQLRRVASTPLRMIGIVVYLLAIAAPPNVGPAAFVRAVVAVVLLGVLLVSIQLPTFLLAGRGWRTVLQIGGGTIAGVGALYAIAAQLGKAYLRRLDAVVDLNFAVPVHLFETGDTIALVGLALVVVATVLSIVVLGTDALPDLYAASTEPARQIRRRERLPVGDTKRYTLGAGLGEGPIPQGAFVFVWTDWVAFVRARNVRTLWVFGWVASFACGIALAMLRVRFGDETAGTALGSGAAILVLVLGPAFSSSGLAAEVSKPLFWLGEAHVSARMAVWTAARSWRSGILLGLAPACAGAVLGDAPLALLSIPLVTCAFWALQALGVLLYALLPNPLDVRGPMTIARVAISALYVAPAVVAGTLVFVTLGSQWLAACAAVATLLLEGYGCIALAAYRLTEFGATLGTLARET